MDKKVLTECLAVLERDDFKKTIKDIISPLTKSISKNILDEIYPYLYLSFIFVVVSFFLHLGILILLLRN